jgi:hypothetical protein
MAMPQLALGGILGFLIWKSDGKVITRSMFQTNGRWQVLGRLVYREYKWKSFYINRVQALSDDLSSRCYTWYCP